MEDFDVNLDDLPDELDLDLSETFSESNDEDGNIDIPDKIFKSYREKIFATIENIKQCGIPKRGEQIRIITMKSFNSMSFIELIAGGETIEELILVIFAINMSAAKSLINLIDQKKVKNTKIIVSSIRNAGHKIKSKAVKLLIDNGIKIIFVNSHAKISALRTKKNSYVIEGSGNMSFNGRIEQYIIDNDKELYDFTLKWVSEIEETMKGKSDLQVYNADI